MYESEVNETVETNPLPDEIKARFRQSRAQITARTILPWGEHCTECVWPTCYTTCELYAPRIDGGCRQFVDGMVRLQAEEGPARYLLRIQFKQWGKLWTLGNLHLMPPEKADNAELMNIAVGAVGRNLPLPRVIKPRLLQKIGYWRRQYADSGKPSDVIPDHFLLECYNPSPNPVNLTVTVRPSLRKDVPPFHSRVPAAPGYTRATIPFKQIASVVDLSHPFEVEILPGAGDTPTLFFGLLEFVKEAAVRETVDKRPWKCVVWDLDNTVWKGILLEDGAEHLVVREEVVDVIRQTDQRGVLHSIASKNDGSDAMAVLRRHSLDHYFLSPQIGWQPKSESVAAIARRLNIGLDSIVFVDDQPFEREEVKAALPDVTVMSETECLTIPSSPRCPKEATADGANRRQMYQQQLEREAAQQVYKGQYSEFLKSCDIRIAIGSLGKPAVKRVYELAQRTNQLNFSGRRYTEAELIEVVDSPVYDTFVVHCEDRFGDYGTVGFALVDASKRRLVDLMFSCRIQGKRIEHALLRFMHERYADHARLPFYASYRPTERNAPAARVFEDIGFHCIATENGTQILELSPGQTVPDDGLIHVTVVTPEHEAVR
jgi:FkbH-like protein